MRQYEKEIIEAGIKDEDYVIRQLKLLYSKSLKQINENIELLTAKFEANGLQSIVYQLDYQKAIKKQITGVLDTLQTGEYETISDYLTKSYENGYVGAMYSFQKQGIPIIQPFDEEQVINAIVHQSKLSKKLYDTLGLNVGDLKKRVSAEVSRGIANGYSYDQIARNIYNASKINYNRSIRIARTEGNRIQGQAQLDACYKAKEKGADVVKQWDAHLDSRTRPTHMQLDGQIREIDEPFEVGGLKAMTHGQFGVASEDINCRCVVLQRAKWALDEEELETLKERAAYYGLDKTKDFEDFRKKYLKAVEEETKEVVEKVEMKADNFPSAFAAKPKAKKNSQLISDFINSQENANPKVVELYSKMGDMEIGDHVTFEIGFGEKNAVTTWVRASTGQVSKQKITLQDLTKNNSFGSNQTNLHELGHLIDSNIFDTTKSGYYTASTKYKDVLLKSGSSMSDEVKELFEKTNKQYNEISDKVMAIYKPKLDQVREDYLQGARTYDDYKKTWKKLYKEMDSAIDTEKRNLGINNLQDIYDALSGGKYRDSGVVKYGHGSKYYRSQENRIEEIFANYMSLSVSRPDLIEMLKRDKPELVEFLDNIVEEMLKGVTK